MGLDVYVGSLTRYTLGDWLTIMQQMGAAQGIDVQMIRPEAEPDVITDPVEIRAAVDDWRALLSDALGVALEWPEGHELSYWTDKPDWTGYGGAMLAAAYDVRPELRPRSGGLLRKSSQDTAEEFERSAAFQAAASEPERYVSLLSGAEWWLPIDIDALWQAPRITGQTTTMSSVRVLVSELEDLSASLHISEDDLPALLDAGPPRSGTDVDAAGRFGVAVLLSLARVAHEHQQPLLLDY